MSVAQLRSRAVRNPVLEDDEDPTKSAIASSKQQLHMLWRLLVEPIQSEVDAAAAVSAASGGVPRLVVVPTGALALVPWAALVDGSKRCLMERFEVSVVPSLRMLLHCLRERPSSSASPAASVLSSGGDGGVLVVGNPDGTLPAAGAEAEAIAGLLQVKPLIGMFIFAFTTFNFF
jgi:CHAT domain-containing protein